MKIFTIKQVKPGSGKKAAISAGTHGSSSIAKPLEVQEIWIVSWPCNMDKND
jgi:hypothetical protein